MFLSQRCRFDFSQCLWCLPASFEEPDSQSGLQHVYLLLAPTGFIPVENLASQIMICPLLEVVTSVSSCTSMGKCNLNNQAPKSSSHIQVKYDLGVSSWHKHPGVCADDTCHLSWRTHKFFSTIKALLPHFTIMGNYDWFIPWNDMAVSRTCWSRDTLYCMIVFPVDMSHSVITPVCLMGDLFMIAVININALFIQPYTHYFVLVMTDNVWWVIHIPFKYV